MFITYAKNKPNQIKTKPKTENFGGNSYVYHLDCGDGFMGIGICPNSSNCIYYIVAIFCISIIPQKSCLKIKSKS